MRVAVAAAPADTRPHATATEPTAQPTRHRNVSITATSVGRRLTTRRSILGLPSNLVLVALSRTRYRRSTPVGETRLENEETPANAGVSAQGPYGIRTRAAAVRGRCPR